MHISHQWGIVTISLETSGDILHVLSLAHTLSGETYEFASGIDDPFGLGHTTLGIVGIHRSHRLNTDGIGAADAYTADVRRCRLSSLIHVSWS